jgi:predicted SnoaL-like aldol condensation-catalyzing enzyme
MKVIREPIEIDGKKGEVTYFDENMELVPKAKATVAKVHFDDGMISFFTVTPEDKPK